ncbi:MAG: hypothetical protein Q9208_005903 [Pyrenodesmia sp. 3 TL-2023]
MAQQRSPDGRLVYLHCSSIFSGANAQVRKAKKISQLLGKHKTAIKILTKEFSLPAIAAVAKELLEERIFDSLPRAKLRYPELFQLSETQEAERAASEAEVIRIEAEAAQDIVLTSDDEGGDECLDPEQGEQKAQPDELPEDKAEAGDDIQTKAVEFPQSASQAHLALSVPRLHPVYLPFKTQHKILVLVQSLLEECCLEFGNTWVPDLMEAQKWKEAESIELTQWTKRFSKHAKSLPLSAIKKVPGKSIAEVLFGTSILRHSAVHRLPTSAAGILNILSAAITFAEALRDSKRAEKVAEIKTRLEASVEEIVQHQNLLERKLTAQFEDIARRRAELDQLERSSIEEMLAIDEKQRTEVGSAFEGLLIGSQQISNPCAYSHTPDLEGANLDSKVDENIESGSMVHELKRAVAMNEAQADDQSPPIEEELDHAEDSEKYERSSWHDNCGASVVEKAEVELDLATLRSRGRTEESKKAAISRWDVTAPDETRISMDEAPASEKAPPTPVHITHNTGWGWPRHETWHFLATGAAEPYNAPEETIPGEESCCAALVETETAAPEAPIEASHTASINEGLDSAREATPNRYDNIPQDIGDPCAPISKPDVAPAFNAVAEDTEFLAPFPKPAEWAGRDFHSSSPSAPPSIKTSVIEATAPEAPTEDSRTIALKIYNSGKIFRSIVFIKDCTRTAIVNEAKAYCVSCAQNNPKFGNLLPERWDLVLKSLKLYGCNMDLTTYKADNLSFLLRDVAKAGIPRFTLQIFGI